MQAETAEHLAARQRAPLPRWRRIFLRIADFELLFVLVPATMVVLINQVPQHWVLVSLLVVPLVWLVRWMARGCLTVPTPLNVPLAMLLFMTAVGLLPSVNLSLSSIVVARTVAGVGIYFALVNSVRSEQALGLLADGLVFAGAGIAVVSLGNTDWAMAKLFSVPEMYERLPEFLTFLNPNGFNRNIVAGTLGMLLPLGLALLVAPPTVAADAPAARLRRHRLLLRVSVGLALPLIGGVLILAQPRGAVAGVIVAVAVQATLHSRRKPLLLLLGMLALLVLVGQIGGEPVTDFFLALDLRGSARGRVELWQRAIYMLQDFPYTGIGVGTFSQITPALYPLFALGLDGAMPHAHNLYLQAGVDRGVPGLVVQAAISTAFLLVGVSAVRRARGTGLYGVALGTLGGYVVYLVHGLVDNVTFSPKPAMVLWTLMGVATAVWHSFNAAD